MNVCLRFDVMRCKHSRDFRRKLKTGNDLSILNYKQWSNNMISRTMSFTLFCCVLVPNLYGRNLGILELKGGQSPPTSLQRPSHTPFLSRISTNVSERKVRQLHYYHPFSRTPPYPGRSFCLTRVSFQQVNIWQRASWPSTCPRYWVLEN